MTNHRTAGSGVSRAAVEQRAGAPAPPGGKWWTLVAVCLGIFMLLLDITIVTVALPDIQRGLGSGFADLQWIVDAYALTLAAFLLTAGSLSDLYGGRLLFLIGLAVFTGASLLCGFATSTLMLQVSRAVQGVGGAIMFAVSLALLAGAFRGKDRGVAFGIWGAITGIGNRAVVGSFVAAGVLLAAFVLAELRGRHPMFDLTLFRRPAFSGGAVAAFGLSASIFAIILYLVLYLQDINSTFRQVGIATGIAVLGTLFSHTLTEQVRATITTVPGMSGRAAQVAGAVQSGQTGRLIAHLPARTGQAVAIITRSALTAGLNQILLVTAIIAFASGLVSLAAIRGKGFVAQSPAPPRG